MASTMRVAPAGWPLVAVGVVIVAVWIAGVGPGAGVVAWRGAIIGIVVWIIGIIVGIVGVTIGVAAGIAVRRGTVRGATGGVVGAIDVIPDAIEDDGAIHERRVTVVVKNIALWVHRSAVAHVDRRRTHVASAIDVVVRAVGVFHRAVCGDGL